MSDDPLWYKDAVFYELHVKAFQDSNGDGIGDFNGLIQRLDYVQDLGVDVIWLLPYYPSPLRDDGYDIADYWNIHPSYGTVEDFTRFMDEAHKRGLRVISDLVLNHTSSDHPWFQRARRAPKGSPERDWYVWSDDDTKYRDARIIFTDTEPSNWTWDPVAGQYYWHRFFAHQPDLNWDNPAVKEKMFEVMEFWLDRGLDGFRADAVPYLIEREGTICENLPETHDILKEFRVRLDSKYQGRILLAEANQWPDDVRPYFGDGDEFHMAFHFPLMPRIFMAVRQGIRKPIVEIIQRTPPIPENCQWCMFLRNHDELTLEMVTDDERDYMYREYAQDSRMRINLGIRRRLAPLMDNDRRKIELMNSILFTMPGSPIIYYGDEIGMGDNVWLGDRDGVRTPMQWTPDRNAGFSRAEAARLYLPAISDSVYGFQAINVEAQQKSPFSLLEWTRRLVRVRKQHHAFGRGSITFLEPENPHVLAYLREHEGDAILVVNNLSGAAQAVRLDLSAFSGRVPVELLGETEFLPIDKTPYALTLSPYGFFWFALRTPRTAEELELHPEVAREWAEQDAEILESPASVAGMVDALPQEWLLRQRWFRGKAREVAGVELAGHAVLRPERAPHVLLARVRVRYREGDPDLYLLPLTLRALEAPGQAPEPILSHATERGDVRVYDALGDRRVAGALLDLVLSERTVDGVTGRFAGHATAEAGDRTVRGPARPMGAEQSNTSVVFGEQYVLKIFRRLEPGINPDLEITRFLVEQAGFRSVPPLAGWIDYAGTDGSQSSVAGLFRYVANRGDAWSVALKAMERFLGAASRSAADPETPTGRDALYRMAGDFFPAVRRLGETTARMHLALATPTDDPAFAAEPVGHDDVRRWADAFRRQVDTVLGDLGRRLEAMPSFFPRDIQPALSRVVRAALDLRLRGDELEVLADAGSVKVRIHGDYHLGQVLRGADPAPDGNEWYPIDFEGEPARPLEERRAKHSVLRDVAGMLRSFDYAVRVSMSEFRVDDLSVRMAVQRWADAWRAEVRSLFVSAYRETLGESPVVPRDLNAMVRALAVFELEKAVYELGYEMNNRPDWIWVPLQAVLALAGEEHA
ncbi:MAG TPA: maltose alpha-D-glucosyltransferase [Longimicrobiaceae bacterium]|nr:maltose alpha-D-glucosyltransferase [Longimicrobiaceae bacterium]